MRDERPNAWRHHQLALLSFLKARVGPPGRDHLKASPGRCKCTVFRGSHGAPASTTSPSQSHQPNDQDASGALIRQLGKEQLQSLERQARKKGQVGP